jgi:Ni/Fe-hydrogenase subunit HybB-like protein
LLAPRFLASAFVSGPAFIILRSGAAAVEKGMGLVVPGFVPSTLHEIVEYSPSLTEWKVTAGIWAFGLMVYTVALKVALPILCGAERVDPGAERSPAAA